MLCPTVLNIIPLRGALWLEVQVGKARSRCMPKAERLRHCSQDHALFLDSGSEFSRAAELHDLADQTEPRRDYRIGSYRDHIGSK